MTLYEGIFNHLLTKLDPETAHVFAGRAIRGGGNPICAPLVKATLNREGGPGELEVFGRRVSSPLGIAAGFDKNAKMAAGLAAMGFGFVEVGTVTAHAQPGNDRPRLFRIARERGLRNRMGFNNDGAATVASRLAALRNTPAGKKLVLGVNIGKSKVTPAHMAVGDYRHSAKLLAPFADYLVINVSSPNTPGLRDLQAVESLGPIVAAVQTQANHAAARYVPVLVKIAPDLSDTDVSGVAELVRGQRLAGVVAVNTTIAHDYGPGGLSGPVLKDRGIEVVTQLRGHLGDDSVIIGVGGISSVADVQAYLAAGATLTQAYTGFVYGGPSWPGAIARSLR